MRRVAAFLAVVLLAGVFTVVSAPAPAAANPLPHLCAPGGSLPGADPKPDPQCKNTKWWQWKLVSPTISACKGVPDPQMPGRGFSGWIDPGPPTYKVGAVDVYGSVQYPPSWTTYDLGCAGNVSNPGAVVDTMVGNWLKGAATSMLALCNSLHRFATSSTFMNGFDPLIIRSSAALREAVFTPYIGIALMLIGVGIVFAARKRDFPKAVEAVVWSLFVITAATVLFNYPVRAGRISDTAATVVADNVNTKLLGQPINGDPSGSRAALLTQNVLYVQWLQGELGSSTSKSAKLYGLPLLYSQTFTYGEAATIAAHPDKAAGIVTKKKHNFERLADQIQHDDPAGYAHLQGKSANRIGAGAESLASAAATVPFMVVADVLQIVARLIARYLVILFPVIAVVGVFLARKPLVLSAFGRVVAAVVNATVFAIGAAFNAVVVAFLLTTSGLPSWMGILLCAITTVMLWSILKPFRHLGRLTSPRAVLSTPRALENPTRVRRTLRLRRRREVVAA